MIIKGSESTPMELVRIDEDTQSKVMVEWSDLGEGINGDYDETDPDDIQLLRFDISVMHKADEEYGWQGVSDASYCTQVPIGTDPEILKKGLNMIMDEIFEAVVEGHSIKKACERMSWISVDSINEGMWMQSWML